MTPNAPLNTDLCQADQLSPEVEAAARRGWPLHPLKARSKLPLLKGWPYCATSDLEQIKTWAREYPGCNWAAVCGPEAGFFVVDLDGDNGLNWLEARVDDGLDLPESWAVHTARGLHLYFQWPTGKTIRNSTGKIASGVDVKGQNGYVLIPPSVHSSGKIYLEVDDHCPVSPAPAWLLNLIETEPTTALPKPKAEPTFNMLPEGRRNDGLTRLAGYLRRKGATRSEIETALKDANLRRCIPPLPENEVSGIAASVARYAPGGPDALETAWKALEAAERPQGYKGFIQLAQALQTARQGLEIALPLERIAKLFGVHCTSVSQWRKRAVATGILQPAGQYIPHRKAGTYFLRTTTLTTGLVRVGSFPIVRVLRKPRARILTLVGQAIHPTETPGGYNDC